MKNSSKKLLITGKNGYISTSFQAYLRDFEDISVETISLRGDEWKTVDFSGFDTVVHMAGLAHSDSGKISQEKAKEYYAINRDLTRDVAEKAKNQGVKQFIYLSSIIIFGESAKMGKEKVIKKDTVPEPANAYGDSKLQAEKALEPLGDERFFVAVVRPPMVYGRNSRGNYPVLSKIGKKLPLFPRVKNQRSMIYIENLCEFLRLLVVNQDSGVFMPQNKEFVETSALVAEINACVGKKICLTGLFNLPLRAISPFVGVVNKVFGSLVYEMSLSVYQEEYCLVGFGESVRRTEDNPEKS